MREKSKRIRVKTVLQVEPTECGAACLMMVLDHFGQTPSMESIRIETNVSRDGCSAGNIVHAARKRGLVCDGYSVDREDLEQMDLPCIIWWKDNHFVVYEGSSGDNHFINDPAFGRRRLTEDEMSEGFSNIVLTFSPDENFFAHPDYGSMSPDRYFRAMLRRVFEDHRKEIVITWVLGAFAIAYGIIAAGLSAGYASEQDDPVRYVICFGVVLIPVLGALLAGRIRSLTRRICLGSAWPFLRRILFMPVEHLEQRSPESMIRKLHKFERNVELAAGSLTGGTISAGCLTVCIIMMLGISRIAVAPAVLGLCLAFASGYLTMVIRSGYSVKADVSQMALAEAVVREEARMRAIRSRRNSGSSLREIGEKKILSEKATDSMDLIGHGGTIARFLIYISSFVLYFRIIIPSGQVSDAFDLIYPVTLFSMMVISTENITRIAAGLSEFSHNAKATEDIEKIPLSDEMEIDGNSSANYRKLKGNLRCYRLSFGYGDDREDLISDLNIYLPAGSSLCITGPSGSGKTTLGKLLAGLIRPGQGDVLYDGERIENINEQARYASIATVSQRSELFEGTIRENIAMWNPDLPEEKILAAVKDACIEECISIREDGLDTVIGKGGEGLSGGEMQRIEIARALAADPSILILDEAFSATDQRTAAKILSNIKARGCTLIIISSDPEIMKSCSHSLRLEKKSGR